MKGTNMTEPQWLTWTREAQAIAQNGLTYCQNPYDLERYEQLRLLAGKMIAALGAGSPDQIEALFAREKGYATPKIDVRAAVFDSQDRILMVRETIDQDRWTLPGGWADINFTTAENALKEVREESGYLARIRKLAAVWDRTRQGHPPDVFSCAKMFYVCDLTGGTPSASMETSEVGWFSREELPDDLSLGRLLPEQLRRMFDHHDHPDLPADYD